MIADVEGVIRKYIPDVIHMSLATSDGNKPWVSEVHYVYDEDLHLYFLSKPSRRHSKEIEKNPTVAGNIIKQHMPNDYPRGVYFEGTAERVYNVDENHIAYKLYCERFDAGEDVLTEMKEEDGHQFYKVSVDTYYLFDAQESNPAHKYELKWSK